MATGQRPARVGCCCEVFIAFDESAERPVARTAAHHCCPTHGRRTDGATAQPR